MDRKKLLLLAAAVIVAILAALLARGLFATAASGPDTAAQRERVGPKVLVARRTLPTGTILGADAVGFQPWPEEVVKDAYYLQGQADIGKLLGTVVRFPITAGEPVTKGSLVAPGERGFLAAALGPGMRAVTLPVSAKTGGAGFVFPGDRVDLVLTETVKGVDPLPLRASQTILRNLRVLATDQSTQNEVVDGKPVIRAFKTATLEVTPKMAEKIAVAQTIGTLSLSLRSLSDSGADLDRAIASGDVTVPEGLSPDAEEKFLRAAMERPLDRGGSYVTGGDVSRFQRRTMPAMHDRMAAASAPAPAPAPVAAARAPAVTVEVDAAQAGPVVRVTRGKQTVAVPVGRN